MYFLLTIDVESFSIPLNRCDYSTGKTVSEHGIPKLIELLSKYEIHGTFYFTGEFASNFPEAIELVADEGHEIGCHGYDHNIDTALDLLTVEQQVEVIRKAKKIIESSAGSKVESFRAPMLRINEDTIKALEITNFKTDSSIASQRFDGPFTFGAKRKLKWLTAPRKPYYPSYDSVYKPGQSKILEIPISALIIPYIGTTLRISPTLTKIIGKILYLEAANTNKPIVFLFHPNECINSQKIEVNKRTNNYLQYIFADLLRQKMKIRNLGTKALKLLEEVIKNAKEKEFTFMTVKDYTRMVKCHKY